MNIIYNIMGLFQTNCLVQYLRVVTIHMAFSHFFSEPLSMLGLYLVQVLLKLVYQIWLSKSHLSVQIDTNVDFLQKIYMLANLSLFVRSYVLLCLSAALYLEVLGAWMLMIAAFMKRRQTYDESSVVHTNLLLSLYHGSRAYRYCLNTLSEAFLFSLYLSAFHDDMTSDNYFYLLTFMYALALPGLLLK